MKIFEPLALKFEDANWSRNPEFGLIDTILETHPELIRMLKDDITLGEGEKLIQHRFPMPRGRSYQLPRRMVHYHRQVLMPLLVTRLSRCT
jgi:hypothetical protein